MRDGDRIVATVLTDAATLARIEADLDGFKEQLAVEMQRRFDNSMRCLIEGCDYSAGADKCVRCGNSRPRQVLRGTSPITPFLRG